MGFEPIPFDILEQCLTNELDHKVCSGVWIQFCIKPVLFFLNAILQKKKKTEVNLVMWKIIFVIIVLQP